MALPKEPRQKMINIMYLVLTALLALNVSSEILNAFETIDGSLTKSNEYLNTRTTKIIGDFDNESIKKQFPDKVAIWQPQAKKVQEISENIYNQIEKYKIELRKEAGQKEGDSAYKKDDLEAGTRLFLNGKVGETKGEQLYSMLANYSIELAKIDSLKNQVASLPNFISIPKTANMNAELSAMSPAQQWSNIYFHMTPAVAAVTILSKFQNDIRNTQTQLIDFCFNSITKVPVPPPTLAAFANSSSEMVMAGDELTITAGLGAYQTEAKPNISIDGVSVPLNATGQAILKTVVSTPGDFTKHINISYKDPSTGQQKTSSAEVKYKVGIPTGINVSADATRYFYAGGTAAPNPITISGAVGGANNIQITPAGGIESVVKTGNGTYNIICTKPGMAVFNVSDGKTTQKLSIKVKALPDPQNAYVFGSFSPEVGVGGQVIANEFKLQTGLKAVLPNDFEFKGVTYKPRSFTMRFSGKGFTGTESVNNVSSFSNPSVASLLNKCVQGSTVQISDIIMEDNVNGEHKLKQTIGFYLK